MANHNKFNAQPISEAAPDDEDQFTLFDVESQEPTSETPDEQVEASASRIDQMRERGRNVKESFDDLGVKDKASEKFASAKDRLKGFAGGLKRKAQEAGYIALGAGAMGVEAAKNGAQAVKNSAQAAGGRVKQRYAKYQQDRTFKSYESNVAYTQDWETALEDKPEEDAQSEQRAKDRQEAASVYDEAHEENERRNQEAAEEEERQRQEEEDRKFLEERMKLIRKIVEAERRKRARQARYEAVKTATRETASTAKEQVEAIRDQVKSRASRIGKSLRKFGQRAKASAQAAKAAWNTAE